IRVIKKALEIDPHNGPDEGELLFMLAAAGHFDEAAQVAEQTKRDHPEYKYVYEQEGYSWLLQSNIERAIADSHKLIDGVTYKNPGYLDLQRIQLYKGNIAESVQNLRYDLEAFKSGSYRFTFTRLSWLADYYLSIGAKAAAVAMADEILDPTQTEI